MVDEVVDPAVELVGIRREGLRLKGVTIPFVGETPTGGERTKFLPRSSKDYFKPHPVPHNHSYSWYQRSTIVGWRCQEYKTQPVPQGQSRPKDTQSDCPQPRSIQSRNPYEVLPRVERHYRQSSHSSSYKRSQTTNDIQTSSQTTYQSRAVCEEGRTSYRCGYKGSPHSGFSACFTNKSFLLLRSCYTWKQ